MLFSSYKSQFVRVRFDWRATRDAGTWEVFKWLRKHDNSNAKWLKLSCDIDARQLTCDYLRETPFCAVEDSDSILLSTHYLRRVQTNFKLSFIFAWTRIQRLELRIISTDGLAGARPLGIPYRLFLVSQWFNSPDESDSYWSTRGRLLSKTRRLEVFSPRPEICDHPPSTSLCRISKDFVLAAPSELRHHFPSIPQIVYASDITLSIREGAYSLLYRLEASIGSNCDLDAVLWEEANRRVEGTSANIPLTFRHLMESAGVDSQVCARVKITEMELNALRLTLHSRERFLYLRAIARSDLAQYLKVIGDSWRVIPEIRPFVIDTRRFPISKKVVNLQRSRVCPDFGCTLGPMPLYFRAQTLGGRAIGLIQRLDPRGNPLLDGLPEYRCFVGIEDLLQSCHRMLRHDDLTLIQEEMLIRANYQKHRYGDHEEFKQLLENQIRSN